MKPGCCVDGHGRTERAEIPALPDAGRAITDESERPRLLGVSTSGARACSRGCCPPGEVK